MGTIRKVYVNQSNPLQQLGDYLIAPGYADPENIIKNLEAEMEKGIVHFSYFTPAKVTIEAFGTFHPDWFSAGIYEEDVDRTENPTNFHYYDLGRCKWLTFDKRLIIALF